MSKNKKVLVSMALAMVMMFGVVGCGERASGGGKSSKQVAVTINGNPISEATYRAYLYGVKMEMEQGFGPAIWDMEIEGGSMENLAKERALDSVITMSISSQKAKEMKMKLTQEEKEEAKTTAANVVQQLKEEFDKEGITEDIMRLMMEDFIMHANVVDELVERFTPSQDAQDFEKFIEENKNRFESVKAQHVLISIKDEEGNLLPEDKQKEAEEKADMVLEKALAGDDMGELAKEYSEDPGSKESGGEYTFQRGQMVIEFEEAAFMGEEGKVYPEVVKTDHGYHIIKTIEKTTASDAEMKAEFEETQKREYIQNELEDWIAGAEVEKTELYETIKMKRSEPQASPDAKIEEEEE